MGIKQLTLWENPTAKEPDPVQIELDSLSTQLQNLRRGLFKRVGILQQEVEELKGQLHSIKMETGHYNDDDYPLLKLAHG